MSDITTDLYCLHDAAEKRQASRSSPSLTHLLQSQIARGFATLRFRPELEADFCRYLRVSGRVSRAVLALLACVAMIATPLLDSRYMGLPPELAWSSRWLQLGLMMPLVIAAGVFCWRWSFSRAIEPVMVVLFAGMVLGQLGQRSLGARYGFDLPLELVGISIAAMFTLARIRFWVMLPAALLACVAVLANELLIVKPDPNAYYHMFATFVLVVIGIASGYSSEYFIRWTWLNGTLLRYISRQDSLTGLLNRHALEHALEQARAHARREGIAYAVAMIDIDAFGAYNDHYGHQKGDAALKQVAEVLQANARRPQDVCGRYGGEEFVILWMGGDVRELAARAQATREAVKRVRIVHDVSPVAPWVTVSIGLCHVDADSNGMALDAVLERADQVLYEAKKNGRNRMLCDSIGGVTPADERPVGLRGRFVG